MLFLVVFIIWIQILFVAHVASKRKRKVDDLPKRRTVDDLPKRRRVHDNL